MQQQAGSFDSRSGTSGSTVSGRIAISSSCFRSRADAMASAAGSARVHIAQSDSADSAAWEGLQITIVRAERLDERNANEIVDLIGRAIIKVVEQVNLLSEHPPARERDQVAGVVMVSGIPPGSLITTGSPIAV